VNHSGPSGIRYPRGKVPAEPLRHNAITFGKAEVSRPGNDVALIAAGSCLTPAFRAAERLEKAGISAMVVNARFLKPLDSELFLSIAGRIPRIITIEDNVLQGGFGSSLLEFLSLAGVTNVMVKRLGIPDSFVEQGSPERLRAKYHLDEEGIYLETISFLGSPAFSN
jgi:1-deoxy-D-xylulose-5-phosphate synthase